MKTIRALAIGALSMVSFLVPTYGQVQVAGTKQVDLDATGLTAGTLVYTITNNGALGGNFIGLGLVTNDLPVATAVGGGTVGLEFDGRNLLQNLDATTNMVPVSASMTGINPTVSIEAWVYASALDFEDQIVSWGRTGGTNSLVAFEYSTGGGSGGGAMNRNGAASPGVGVPASVAFAGPNVAWGSAIPQVGAWHYLVYTFDGPNRRNHLYADGLPVGTTSNYTDVNVWGLTNVVIAASHGGGAINGVNTATRARMVIARVRVDDGLLSAANVANNYSFEAPAFSVSPAPLSAGPAHRWSFWTIPATNDANNVSVADTGSQTSVTNNATIMEGYAGSASSDGTTLHMGGGYATGAGTPAYINLPAHLISSQSVSNGGSAQVTFEGWCAYDSDNTWSGHFSFGSVATNATYPIGQVPPGFNTTLPGYSGATYLNWGLSGQSVSLVRLESFNGQPYFNNNTNTVTITNPPAAGATITIGTTVLTWASPVTTPSTQILIGPDDGTCATNLFNQVTGNPISGVTAAQVSSNRVSFGGFQLIVSTSTNTGAYATVGLVQFSPGGTVTHDFSQVTRKNPYSFSHWVLTWDEASSNINCFVNGVLVTHMQANLSMWQLNDVNDWLGRDNWSGDGYFGGNYTELRQYNRILSPAEITSDYIFGPQIVRTAGAEGALGSIAIQPLIFTNLYTGGSAQLQVLAQYANVSNVDVTQVPGITYSSDTPGVASVTPAGLVNFLTVGSANIKAIYGGFSNTLAVTTIAPSATLIHRYPFSDGDLSTTVTDVVGGATATIIGTFELGGKFALDSSASSYMLMPSNILSGNDALTMEAWADFASTNAANTYVWAFGNSSPAGTGNNAGIYGMFMSPQGNTRTATFDANPGFSGEQNAQLNGGQAGKNNVHIVAVYSPELGIEQLYLNGTEVAEVSLHTPLSHISGAEAYLGRSLYPADPYMTGNIDEFRIYSGVLSPSQIALDTATGPNLIVNNPGALSSVTLTEQFPTFPVGVNETIIFTGNFANVSNVNLFSYGVNGGYTLSNSNPSVVSFNPATQVITGLTNGSATLIASFGGLSATNLITVFVSTPVVQHEYKFNNDTLPVALDSVGGPAGNGSYAGSASNVGGQAVLNATTGDYIVLPTNIFSGYFSASIECWASFGTNVPGGGMLWAFGSQDLANIANNYLYMIPNVTATGATRTGVTASDPGNTGEQNASLGGVLDNRTNVYIAAVYSPFRGFQDLYINGAVAATNTLTILLSNVFDNFSYLGRSLYFNGAGVYQGDPTNYLNASIDDFRISTGELTAQQIAVNVGSGPNLNVPVSGVGALSSITITPANPSVPLGQTLQLQVLGTFANVTNVNMFGFNGVAGVTSGVTFTSSDATVASVSTNGIVTGNGLGTSTITAVVTTPSTKTNTTLLTVTRGPFIALRHRYTFTTDVRDVVNHGTTTNWDGALEAGAYVSNNAVQLNGIAGFGSYVALPPGLLSSQTNLTIEAWASTSDPSTAREWQRVFDIGSNTGLNSTDPDATNLFLTNQTGIFNYATNGYMTNGAGVAGVFLTSTANTGTAAGVPTGNFARFAYSTNDNNGQGTEVPTINSITGMGTNQMTHYAVVLDFINNNWQLWQNGVLMPAGTGAPAADVTTANGVPPLGPTFGTNVPVQSPNGPLGGLIDVNAYLGRSAWSGDPYWLGSLTDVRVWEGTLTGNEIQQFHNAGPQNAVFPALKLTQVGTNVVASWPSWAGRYLLQGNTSATNAAGWTNFPIASIVDVSTNRQVTVPITGTPRYLRLSN